MKLPEELIKIINDNVSGSEELRNKLIAFFINEIQKKNNIRIYFPTLSEHFKEFATISNLISTLEKIDYENIEYYLREEINSSKNIYSSLYKNLEQILSNNAKIITISNSNTLTQIFNIAFNQFPKIKFYVSESRPINEGIIMAERLSQIGFDVTLITEAMIPKFVKKCDFALSGADKILPDGGIINKIGTKSLAISCKYYGKPFYVVSKKNKFTQSPEIHFSEHSESEIYSGKAKTFSIAKNVYFEKIDSNLITKIITEDCENKN